MIALTTADEKQLLDMPQIDCPITHHFGPNLYIREILIPAGTFIIGHSHNQPTMNIFLKGKISLLNEDMTVSTHEAPMTFVGKEGRKVAFAHEECIWQNVFATEETDIEKLEATYVTKSEVWKEHQLQAQMKLLKESL
jgi:hypothetical protein